MNPGVAELFDLTGKVAVVTGGGGWLGTAVSEGLAEAGAKVAVVDYLAEAVAKTVERLRKAGLDVFGVVADVMDDKPLRDCIDQVAKDCGRLDVLVNGAHGGPTPEADAASFADYDQGLHSGPSAYGIAAQQAAVHMRKVGGGSIIHFGSMYGVVTGYPEVYEGILKPNSIVYQAGKAGIIHMTRYMAVYWAKDHIRVNCVSPGPFPTELTQKEKPEFQRRLEQKSPMGRLGQPWEIKGVMVFLASAASSYVTGQNILVDGGWTAW